jgi:hypothetical protein
VLGVPTRFESNSPTVIAQVEASYGNWRVLATSSQAFSAERVLIRIIVEEGTEGPPPVRYRYRVTDGLIVITTPGSVAVCDLLRRHATAWVTNELAADSAQFDYSMLSAITLGILTQLDRQPLHAAAIQHDGHALLLAGRSGAGKSTLVYALARAGFEIVSDDVVFAQLQPALRLWGLPRVLNLTEDARRFFPEMRGNPATMQVNGKQKISVDVNARGWAARWPVADALGVCLLQRNGAKAALSTAPAEDVVRFFTDDLESGFDVFADTIAPVARQLAQLGAWHLQLGSDPAEAVQLIESIYEELTAR